MHLITIGDTNVKTQKTTFSPEFRLEKTQSVVDNRYTHKGATKAMGVGYSTIINWVKQLREEYKNFNEAKQAVISNIMNYYNQTWHIRTTQD